MSGNQVPDGVAPPAAPPDPANPVADATQDGAGDGPAQVPTSEGPETASKMNLIVSRIEQRLVDAGLELDDVDTHTDAQLEQAGRILAEEFGMKLTADLSAQELGGALLTLRRAVKHTFASID